MSVVIASNAIVLSTGEYAGANNNNPIIGYQNLATVSNITATSEQENYPVTNLANPATNLLWKAADESPAHTEDVYITVVVNSPDDIDYIGIARHNLGSGSIPVSVEGLAVEGESPEDWQELVSEVLLPNDSPALFVFEAQSLYAVRLRLKESGTTPQMAVLYTGKSLMLQRRIYVGHTPINYGRSSNVVSGRSESGQFLGRILISEATGTSISMKNITPSWFRTFLDPFLIAAKTEPFFFAWRPNAYPYEVGFCWTTGDPVPSNSSPNGMMSIDIKVSGVI